MEKILYFYNEKKDIELIKILNLYEITSFKSDLNIQLEIDNLDFELVLIKLENRNEILKIANFLREKKPEIPIMIITNYYHSFDFNMIKGIQGYGQIKIFPLVNNNSLKIIEAVNSMLHPEYPSKTENIAIVLPVYNEETRFENVINFSKKLELFLEKSFLNTTIHFINDGSSDKTNSLVENLINSEMESSEYISDKGFISLKELKENTKKAGTYIEGIKSIECDIMVFVDADDSFEIEDIAKMINILKEGYFDMVVGSKDFTAEKRSFVRKLLSFAKRTLTKFLLPVGVYDAQTGLKAIKSDTAKYIFPYLNKEQGLAIDLEMLYLAKKFKFRVLQLPVRCIDREGSHVDIIKDSIKYLKSIVAISLKKYKLNRE